MSQFHQTNDPKVLLNIVETADGLSARITSVVLVERSTKGTVITASLTITIAMFTLLILLFAPTEFIQIHWGYLVVSSTLGIIGFLFTIVTHVLNQRLVFINDNASQLHLTRHRIQVQGSHISCDIAFSDIESLEYQDDNASLHFTTRFGESIRLQADHLTLFSHKRIAMKWLHNEVSRQQVLAGTNSDVPIELQTMREARKTGGQETQ